MNLMTSTLTLRLVLSWKFLIYKTVTSTQL